MSAAATKTFKLTQLNKKQVHAMALENLKRHLELKSAGEQSAPDSCCGCSISSSGQQHKH